MELAREAATKAKDEKCQENKKTVDIIKEKDKKRFAEREERLNNEFEERKVLIKGVIDSKVNVTLERQKIFANNKNIHDEQLLALKLIY